ncbi:MAG: hypothetical protein WDN31_23115 [Hyphomicrobium sp.]
MMRNSTSEGWATAQAERLPRETAARAASAWSWRHLDDAHRHCRIDFVHARSDDLLPGSETAGDDGGRLSPGR